MHGGLESQGRVTGEAQQGEVWAEDPGKDSCCPCRDSPLCWLPQIEIELGMKCWYHSVFACPILRQQTSDSNPPIKLICGHVISRDALNKLINGGK